MRGIKKVAGKVLYLLSFVLAAIITCLIFNSVIYDVSGVKNKASKNVIKGESLNRECEEIKLLGILHIDWNYMKITNVIFNTGCIYLDENGMVVNSFKYDYPYSVRHMQETVKYELYDKYKSKELNISEVEEFLSTYFDEIDYSERNKTLHEMIQRKKIEVYDIKASELNYQESQKMIKLIEERGIDRILKEENWFID